MRRMTRDKALKQFSIKLNAAIDDILKGKVNVDENTLKEIKRSRYTWLARQLDVTDTATTRYFKGLAIPHPDSQLYLLAKVLKKPNDHFEFCLRGNILAKNNILFRNTTDRLVPVLSYRHIPYINGDVSKFINDREIHRMHVEDNLLPPNTLCVKVEGDSMAAVSGFSLPDGSLIYANIGVDAIAAVQPEDVVIFSKANDPDLSAGVGVYKIKEGKPYIYFINNQVLPIEIDADIEIKGVGFKCTINLSPTIH